MVTFFFSFFFFSAFDLEAEVKRSAAVAHAKTVRANTEDTTHCCSSEQKKKIEDVQET